MLVCLYAIDAMNNKTPRLTVDAVLFHTDSVLLIQRKFSPFQGKWALPGGFVEFGETTEDAVLREFLEETGVRAAVKTLVGVYSDPLRDPRGHTVSVVYLVESSVKGFKAGDDAQDVKFFEISKLPDMGFDHEKIVSDAWRMIVK